MERLTEFWEGTWILSIKAVKQGYDKYSAISRLAAYEDTGLEPEEVAELAKAKKDGRLLVLPCKVGTPVWSTMFRKIILDDNGKFIREEPTSNWPFDTDMISDWGECWFMTREEAEAALDKQKGE